MNSRHRKTLNSIFENPIRADVKWSDIEALFRAMGAEISEGNGSRVRIFLHGTKAVFHRPHPQKETDKGALVSVRRFIINSGAKDEI